MNLLNISSIVVSLYTSPTNIIQYHISLDIIIFGARRMKIIITEHANKRINDYRQDKIDIEDIIEAAKNIPGNIPNATRFRGFISKSGRVFDIVAKDTNMGRLVITIIGK